MFQRGRVQYLSVPIDAYKLAMIEWWWFVALTYQLSAQLTTHECKELSGEEQNIKSRVQLHIIQLYVSMILLRLEFYVHFWSPQKW